MLKRVAAELVEVAAMGVQVAVVLGGGNIFRGAGLARAGMDRVTADQMGMLATVINSLAMQDAVEAVGAHARVMSAIRINEVAEDFVRRRAIRHLEKRRIVIFAAGIGKPYFTTDTAASLRAVEIGADLLLKATKVNGVYSDDPMKNPAATRYETLGFDRVLDDRVHRRRHHRRTCRTGHDPEQRRQQSRRRQVGRLHVHDSHLERRCLLRQRPRAAHVSGADVHGRERQRLRRGRERRERRDLLLDQRLHRRR